jgi:hypothetical protein
MRLDYGLPLRTSLTYGQVTINHIKILLGFRITLKILKFLIPELSNQYYNGKKLFRKGTFNFDARLITGMQTIRGL